MRRMRGQFFRHTRRRARFPARFQTLEPLEPRRLLSNSPAVIINGPPTIDEGQTYTLNLATDSTTAQGWTIHWGDGAVSNLPGSATQATHVYADGPDLATITATLTDAMGDHVAPFEGQGGELDPTFGTNGWTTTDYGHAFDSLNRIKLQPDGKIIGAASGGNRFNVVRYTETGLLDTTFADGDGRIFVDGTIPNGDVALQSDGSIIAATGRIVSSPRGFLFHRYSSHGVRDLTFGTQGETFIPSGIGPRIRAVRVTPDDRVVFGAHDFVNDAWNLVVGRLLGDGTPDPSFAGDGSIILDINDGSERLNDIELRPDGRILVGGSTTNQSGDRVYMLAQFDTDGTLDETFGDNGVTVVPRGVTFGTEAIHDVELLPDGRILAVGIGEIQRSVLLRFSADGALDTTFGDSGIVNVDTFASNDSFRAMARDAAGRIIAVGQGGTSSERAATAVRFSAEGEIDTTWGDNGVLLADFGTESEDFTDLIITPDGILVSGAVGTINVNDELLLARLLPGGATVEVQNVNPFGTFQADAPVLPGHDASVTFTNSGDVPADVAAGFTYSYDFDSDGNFEIVGSNYPTAVVPASFLPLSGTHLVIGELRDKDGGARSYGAQVEVLDAMTVVSVWPGDGAFIGFHPNPLEVTFSQNVNPATVDPGDLTVNGVPATGVSINGDHVSFSTAFLDDGVHQIAIAAGALESASGQPVEAFSSSFTVDTEGPRVIATSLEAGTVLTAGEHTFTVQFDELIDESQLELSALRAAPQGSGGSPAKSFSYDPATSTLSMTFDLTVDASYTLRLIDDAQSGIVDLAGNELDGEVAAFPLPPGGSGNGIRGGSFNLPFAVDSPGPIPIELFNRQDPLGSFISAIDPLFFNAHGQIHGNGDVDEFLLPVQAGEMLSLFLFPFNGQPTFTLSAAGEMTTGGLAALNLRADQLPAGGGVLPITVTGDSPADYVVFVQRNLSIDFTVSDSNPTTSLDPSRIVLPGNTSRWATSVSLSSLTNRQVDMTLDLTGKAGRKIDVVLKVGDMAGDVSTASIDLLGPDGATVLATVNAATTPAADNFDLALLDFTVPEDGVYTLRVGGDSLDFFTLLVTDGLAFEQEPNFINDPQRDLTDYRGALGWLSTTNDNTLDTFDVHEILLVEGQTITVRTFTPFGAVLASPLNDLDPRLALRRNNSSILATSNDNGAADGRNAVMTYTVPLGRSGVYDIDIAAVSGAGEYVMLIDIAPPPVASRMIVNDGDNQRSMVTSLAFVFSHDVAITAEALSLMNTTTSQPVEPWRMLFDYDADTHTAVWTFPAMPGMSLADGDHEATLHSDMIAGGLFDGDGDGIVGGEHVAKLHRLFGDQDGDRDVDFADLFPFRLALQSAAPAPAYNAAFDSDADGDVDFVDLFDFRRNLQTALPPIDNGIGQMQANGPDNGNAPLRAVSSPAPPPSSPTSQTASEFGDDTAMRTNFTRAAGAFALLERESTWTDVRALRQFHASLR